MDSIQTQIFKVKFKDKFKSGFGQVYAIRERNGETEFLIFRYGSWEWHNMNEFVPHKSTVL